MTLTHSPQVRIASGKYTRGMCLVAAVVITVLGITSCQSPPTPTEIDQQFDHYQQVLDQALQAMIEACASHSDPQQCCDDAIDWYNEQKQRLLDAHQDAINENWEDAYQRRKEWEEKFREMFPNDFPEIWEIIKPLLVASELSYDLELEATGGTDPCEEVITMVEAFRSDWETIDLRYDEELLEMVNNSPCFRAVTMTGGAIYAQAQEGDTWSITGTVASKVGSTTTTASVTGSLGLVEGWTETQGNTRWVVVSGQLYVNIGNSTILQLSVLDEVTNGIEVNSSGAGTLKVLFKHTYPSSSWKAIMPYYNWVELPVTVGSGGEFLIDSGGWIDASELAPYSPWPASDYNNNDVLDYTTDYAAFSTAHGNEEPLADQDVDGDWDQDDIDLWTDRFWADYAAQ